MTIKQQGGIFGRNPTFNNVEASKLDIDNINIDGNTISSTDANGNVILDPNGTGSTKVERTLLVNTDAGTNETRLVSIRVNGTDREIFAHEPGGNARPLVLRTQELTFRNDAAVHATFNTSGNLAFSSGKGIDFSATSGTGTSELFDDYEEGTWTVELTDASSGGNASATTTTGYYTKIGRTVHATFGPLNNIDTTGMTAGNAIRINLPFVAGQAGAGVLITDQLDFAAGKTAVYPMVAASSDRMTVIEAGDGVADGQVLVSAINSGTTDIGRMTVTYIV